MPHLRRQTDRSLRLGQRLPLRQLCQRDQSRRRFQVSPEDHARPLGQAALVVRTAPVVQELQVVPAAPADQLSQRERLRQSLAAHAALEAPQAPVALEAP